MKKIFFALLLSLLLSRIVTAQTVIFDPATFNGVLRSGMEIVDIDGTKYLQVVLDGWSSTITIPMVGNLSGTQIVGNVKYSLGTTSISSSLTLAKISSVVQIRDTIHMVPSQWNPSEYIPAATVLAQNPTTEGWSLRKSDVPQEMTVACNIQFYGQKTTDWSPTTGDTIWVGRLVSVYKIDSTALFDPAIVDASTLPEGMEIVTDNGEKLLKVKVKGWNSFLPITPFEVGDNNKMTVRMKYDSGTSGVVASNAQSTVNATRDSITVFGAALYPAQLQLTKVVENAKPRSIINGIQIAAQHNTGNWDAFNDAYVYIGKITMSHVDGLTAPIPNKTDLDYSTNAASIVIDGVYEEIYGDVANVVNRVSLNKTDGDISEINNSGKWFAVADLENFYFFMNVYDDDPISLGESKTPWLNDGIELYMDIQNRHYIAGKRIAGQQHQIRINFGTQGPAKGDYGMETFFGDNDITNIEYAIATTTVGYDIEARIPWATWYRTNSNTSQQALDAISLNENMRLAFEVSILDANARDAFQSILNWANNSGENVTSDYNEFWGMIILKGEWKDPVSNNIETKKFDIYPNPTSEVINLSTENARHVQIFNVLGSKVIDCELNGTKIINVANLQKGIYILKATDNAGRIAIEKFTKN